MPVLRLQDSKMMRSDKLAFRHTSISPGRRIPGSSIHPGSSMAEATPYRPFRAGILSKKKLRRSRVSEELQTYDNHKDSQAPSFLEVPPPGEQREQDPNRQEIKPGISMSMSIRIGVQKGSEATITTLKSTSRSLRIKIQRHH